MNLPKGLLAQAYIVVSALVLAVQIVTVVWISHGGDKRDRVMRGEIMNSHKMPLRDDLDDKTLRTLGTIESLRGAVDGLRDDMNGKFATVNRCITTTEQNLIELRHEVNDLWRGGNNHQQKGPSMTNTVGVADHKAANTTTILGLTVKRTKSTVLLLVQLSNVVQTGLSITGISQLPLMSDQVNMVITSVIAVIASIYSWWCNNNAIEVAVQGQQLTTAIKNGTIAVTQGTSLPPETTGLTYDDIDTSEQALKAHADASLLGAE